MPVFLNGSLKSRLLIAWWILAVSLIFLPALPADPAGAWRGAVDWVLESIAQMDPFCWQGLGETALWSAKAGLVLLGVAALSWVIGLPLFFCLRGRTESWSVIGFGLIIIAGAMQGLGMTGLWFKPVFVWTAVVLGLAAWRFRLRFPRFKFRHPKDWPVAAWLSLGIFGFLVLLSRIPTNAEDPFLYHWAAIEQYLDLHKILSVPYCMAWNFPLFVEMIYAPALAFLGEDGARLVNAFLLAAIIWTLLELGRGWGDSRARWWGVWILLGSFNVSNTILNGKNDLGAVLFGLLAVGILLRGFDKNCRLAWLAGGAFGGALMTTKLIDAGILAGMLMAVWYLRKELPWSRIGLACIGGAVVALPWYLQIWLLSGNPVVPLALPFFNNPWWGPEEAKGTLQGFRVWADPDMLLPTGVLAGIWAMCKSGVAMALLAPLAFLGRNLNQEENGRERKFILITIVVAYAAWALSPRRAIRYLFPLEPLIALLAIQRLTSPSRGLRRLLLIATLLQLVHIGIYLRPVFEDAETLPFLLGQVSRQEIIERRFTSKYAVKEWINKHLQRSDGIWLTGEDRRFGFVPKVISQFYADKRIAWVWAKECHSAEQMAKKARQFGVSHILLNPVSAIYRSSMWYQGRNWSDREIAVYRDFFRRYARPIYRSPRYDYFNGQYHLYSLDGDPKKPKDFIWFLPGTEGVASPLNAPWQGKKKPSAQEYLDWKILVTEKLGNVGLAREFLADGFIRIGKLREATRVMDELYSAGYEGDGTASDFARLLLLGATRFDEAIRASAKGVRCFPGNDRLLILGQAIVSRGIELAREDKLKAAGELADRAGIIARICSGSRGVENVYYSIGAINARLGRYREARRYSDLAWSHGLRGKEIENLRAYLGSPGRR